jgi:hypothetical protein
MRSPHPVPVNNFPGNSFYQISLELLIQVLSSRFDYRIHDAVVMELYHPDTAGTATRYSIPLPSDTTSCSIAIHARSVRTDRTDRTIGRVLRLHRATIPATTVAFLCYAQRDPPATRLRRHHGPGLIRSA